MRTTRWSRVPMILAVLALGMAGCASEQPRDAVSETETSSTSSAGTSGPSSAVGSIPRIELLTELGAQADGGSLARDDLATLVAEQLGGRTTASVQTVVCEGGLALGGGGATVCTVSAQADGRSSDETWNVYATRGPGGRPAVLLLDGDPLTDEFVQVLGRPGVYTTTASIDATYGTSPIDAAHVQQDAQGVLRRAGADAQLESCDGELSFATFAPVVCGATAGGARARVIVLPGSFVADAPGLMVVVEPTG